jgi:hypothetical protein
MHARPAFFDRVNLTREFLKTKLAANENDCQRIKVLKVI